MGLRGFKALNLYSPKLLEEPLRAKPFFDLFEGPGKTASIRESAPECAKGADVVMLCTSSGEPVIGLEDLSPGALVTSISTNLPQAREIAPEALPGMDVYCDYRPTTPSVAGEMVLASKAGLWSEERIIADLPALCSGAFKPEAFERPMFFRSVGLGIEDVAAAYALLKSQGR
jgi:L-arginine dehydrogenase